MKRVMQSWDWASHQSSSYNKACGRGHEESCRKCNPLRKGTIRVCVAVSVRRLVAAGIGMAAAKAVAALGPRILRTSLPRRIARRMAARSSWKQLVARREERRAAAPQAAGWAAPEVRRRLLRTPAVAAASAPAGPPYQTACWRQRVRGESSSMAEQ